MNRSDMSEEVAKRVPMLALRDRDEWKQAEQLRAEFIADYPIKRITSLSLEEYVIGKGRDNRSFCYRIEREMDTLGMILGATALKFGVYFGRTKSDATDRYRFAQHWGNNLDEAFTAVKRAIVELLDAAAKGDSAAITANALSPMFKGKILFLYNPEQFAPIYSEEHLEHFITELDLRGSFTSGADMQRALMEYRASWPELRAQPPALYMRLLYDVFGYPPEKNASEIASVNVPLLDQAVKGAQFVSQMPPLSAEPTPKGGNQRKRNFEKELRNFKRIGDRGEALVIEMEKWRLTQAGKSELATRIKHVSQEDDTAGYDILSFDQDGTPRHIEVKATTGKNLDRGLYITGNEVTRASELPNYYLYLVFSAMSKEPRIYPMKQPSLNGDTFVLRPVVYHATLSHVPD